MHRMKSSNGLTLSNQPSVISSLHDWSITDNLPQICPDIQHLLCPRKRVIMWLMVKLCTSMRRRSPLWDWAVRKCHIAKRSWRNEHGVSLSICIWSYFGFGTSASYLQVRKRVLVFWFEFRAHRGHFMWKPWKVNSTLGATCWINMSDEAFSPSYHGNETPCISFVILIIVCNSIRW